MQAIGDGERIEDGEDGERMDERDGGCHLTVSSVYKMSVVFHELPNANRHQFDVCEGEVDCGMLLMPLPIHTSYLPILSV